MNQFSYIKKINITGLWNMVDMEWRLNRDVNILSGHNGSGKSAIMRSLVELFRKGSLSAESLSLINGVSVKFENEAVLDSSRTNPHSCYKIDVISTFDNRLEEAEALKSLSEGLVRTELDLEIFHIQKRYMSYQLEQSRRVISLLKKKAPEQDIESITRHKDIFFDIIDELFAPTHKSINRNGDDLSFITRWGSISPYALSSGEKQMLIILATVLIQDNNPSILVMDEPEISLHFDWQNKLIENIIALNPNVQIIMSTHSPAVIMHGWIGHVTDIEDIVV